MEKLMTIPPIAVKDKNDVLKVLAIIEKHGIKLMTEEQKNDYLMDETYTVGDNYFMVQDNTGRFKLSQIKSISIEMLEEIVDNKIKEAPALHKMLFKIHTKMCEIDNMKEKLAKKIKEKNDKS